MNRWAGIGLINVVGLLGLHLPRYLAEAGSPGDYAGYPGPFWCSLWLGR